MKKKVYFFLLPILMLASCSNEVKTEVKDIPEEIEVVEESDFKPSVLMLKGNYYGKNVIVQNPFSESGIGFCVDKILVNGEYASCELAASQIEIDLSSYGDREVAEIEIEIHHSGGCLPKILNPNVLDYATDTVGNIVAPLSM